MPESFTHLDIDGSFIHTLRFVPSKTVDIRLLHAPKNETARQVTLQYDLHFQGVYGLRSHLDAQPWLEIKAHHVLLQSEYLKEITTQRSGRRSESTSELSHFQFICDEGAIDIIAEYFTSHITDEIPFVGSFASLQAQQPSPQMQVSDDLPESPELTSDVASPAPLNEPVETRCAFCGRERAEVANIITGSEANICGDCVMICVGLIEPTPKNTE